MKLFKDDDVDEDNEIDSDHSLLQRYYELHKKSSCMTGRCGTFYEIVSAKVVPVKTIHFVELDK